jgi:hypothetical protein
MTGRISGDAKGRISENRHASVLQELAQERAASLGRAGQRLERALEALAALGEGSGPGDPPRTERLEEAGEALFFYIVQREACGLRDSAEILDELRVPREVQLRMGVRRRR